MANKLHSGVGSITFGLGGVQILDIETQYDPEILSAIAASDSTAGDENLYLKGGDGSIALIDLFGPDYDNDGIEDQLEALRDCNVIINEANLIFYVDQDKVAPGSGEAEPERVFIYDFCPTLPPPPPPPSINLNDCFLPYVPSVQVENRIIATSEYNIRLPNRSIVEILDSRNIPRQQSSFDAYLKDELEKRSTNIRKSQKTNSSYGNILYQNVGYNLVLIDGCIRGFRMQTNVFKGRRVSPRWRYLNKRQNRALRAANFREATVLSRTLPSEQVNFSNRYRSTVKKRAIWAHWWFA